VQELSAHLVLVKDSRADNIGQIQVSWSPADAENVDADGKLAVRQYNVSWTNVDDGSHGEMCLEPHVHKCSVPAKQLKYVTLHSYIQALTNAPKPPTNQSLLNSLSR